MTVTNILRATKTDLGLHTGNTLRLKVTLKNEDDTVKSATGADEIRFVLRIDEGDIVKTLNGSGIVIDTTNPDGKGRILVTVLPQNTVGVQGQTGRYELSVAFGVDRATALWGDVRVTKSFSEPAVDFSLAELADEDDSETDIADAA
jgi:hypothetical protein